MLSVLVFMCRDPGDATSKVSCCVQTSYCFKNTDFDVGVKVPVALALKMSLTRKQKYGFFVVIMLLHKGLTHKHSQKKPRLHVGERFNLTGTVCPWRPQTRLKTSPTADGGLNLPDTCAIFSCNQEVTLLPSSPGATLNMRPAPLPMEEMEWRQTPPPLTTAPGTFRLRRGSRFTWRKECLAVMERWGGRDTQ